MPEKFARFDAADYLNDEDEIAALLEAASEDGDPAVMAMALGAIARARNLSQLARDTGLTRAGLRRALSGDGNPSLDTVVKVAKALNVKIEMRPVGVAEDAPAWEPSPKRGSPRRRSSR